MNCFPKEWCPNCAKYTTTDSAGCVECREIYISTTTSSSGIIVLPSPEEFNKINSPYYQLKRLAPVSCPKCGTQMTYTGKAQMMYPPKHEVECTCGEMSYIY